jgi:hypothetical protein
MNATTTPTPSSLRPVYEGMKWEQSRSKGTVWLAKSETTPITYMVEEIDDGQWSAKQGFPTVAGRPNIELGAFASMDVAMTSCERHDFKFWASEARRSGLSPVFMGSPDHVSDFVQNLAEYEKDDLLEMISGGYELPDGRNFTHSASFFQARKSGLKQERNGDFTMTLSIAAADLPMWLMQTAPGSRIVAGAVEVESDDADSWNERATNALKRSFALAQDNNFHSWMAQKYDRWNLISAALMHTSEEVERAVSETMRRIIGCPSRRDLATNRDAVQRLEKIDREFYLDCSRGFTGTLPGQNGDM